MKKVYLYRLNSTDEGSFGILSVDDKYWHSLELPDRDNKPNMSRIPQGTYHCSLRYSNSFRKTLYAVRNVPNRSYILFHGANLAGDTEKGFQSHLQGCITVGKSLGRMKNKFGNVQRAVFSSQIALGEFMSYLNKEDFSLEIQDI